MTRRPEPGELLSAPGLARPYVTRPTRADALSAEARQDYRQLRETMVRLAEMTAEAATVTGLHEFSEMAEEIRSLIDEEFAVRYRRFLVNWVDE